MRAQDRGAILFDGDPIYYDMASLFASLPTSSPLSVSRVRLLTPATPSDRWQRGSVAILFALLAMLAGLIGVATSRHLVGAARPAVQRAVPTEPSLPAPVATTPRMAVVPAPAPIRVVLSQPPRLAPIIRKAPAVTSPVPPKPALATAVASQRTPHLTGAALIRALAQDVIDTRRLNEGVLDGVVSARRDQPDRSSRGR